MRPPSFRLSPHRVLLPLGMVTLLLLIATLSGIYAGGPWLVLPGGPPMRWAAPYSVTFDVDAGGLGLLSHGDALSRFQEGLAVWDAVGPVDLNIDFDVAHQLP
ncbi:MAG: hypothetical protein L0170_02080, partial [Acidobacteria bacterium]|nr:hypothetical protein [Acidobacteriota bacterium]